MTNRIHDADCHAKLARLQPIPCTEMPSQTDKSTGHARRLRSSCDACGAAKTKCDRRQPRCGRCVSMNLTCVHGPSKQLGKRPRRRLDLGPGPFERSEPSANAHSANRSPAIEDLAATEEEHHSIYDQCPILGIGIMPPEDIQLSLPSEPSIVWPLLDNGLLGSRHRCYHESNEVMQLLSIPENLFPDDAPTVLEVSQILQANRRAIESINRLVSCNCAKTRGHQALLYASLISRTLFWYREAAADEIYQPKNIMGVLSPNTSSGSLVSSHNVTSYGCGRRMYKSFNFSLCNFFSSKVLTILFKIRRRHRHYSRETISVNVSRSKHQQLQWVVLTLTILKCNGPSGINSSATN